MLYGFMNPAIRKQFKQIFHGKRDSNNDVIFVPYLVRHSSHPNIRFNMKSPHKHRTTWYSETKLAILFQRHQSLKNLDAKFNIEL